MNLNLHIIVEDLKDLGVQSIVESDCLQLDLRCPALLEANGSLIASRLYITDADRLNQVSRALLGKTHFLVSGVPDNDVLRLAHNIIWVDSDRASVAVLLERVVELFARYQDWHLSLEGALSNNRKLRRLGELSEPMFGRPIWVKDYMHQTIFHVVDRHRYDLPKDYVVHEDDALMPSWEIEAWDMGMQLGLFDPYETSQLHEPYMLPRSEWFDYASLAENVFLGDQCYATIMIDELDRPFTGRDYALLHFFTGIMQSAIKYLPVHNMSMTALLDQRMNELLANKTVAYNELSNALHSMGWYVKDAFVCFVATPADDNYSQATLRSIGERTCAHFHHRVVYATKDSMLVFVANLTQCGASPHDIAKMLVETARTKSHILYFGASTSFANLENLFLFFKQACRALSYGKATHRNAEENVCSFVDDCMLDIVLANICDHATPEIICPSGLMELVVYDLENSTNLVAILRVLLDDKLYITKAARELYMHRNTLMSRKKEIERLSGIDFDDADQCLVYGLGIRALKRSAQFREVLERESAPGADALPEKTGTEFIGI